MSPLSQRLSTLCRPVIEGLGCYLWGLQLQANSSVLKVYIDKEEGITISDCERISKQLSSFFDVENLIHQSYTLEVSSPGFDRPLYTLDQFRQFIGSTVKLSLNPAVNERRKMRGLLTEVNECQVTLKSEGELYQLPFENIGNARIVPVFN